uniref:G_PROTEIN_RECEP_F1_2 domain-containing protein n=1 Tax=Globodera pallida TaxID=36090 RepID=A0A183CBI1_GLOPA
MAFFSPYIKGKDYDDDDGSNKFAFGAQEICTFEQWTQLPNQPGPFRIFMMIAILAMLVILVVGGNALVIAAVMLRRRLRSATGLLILSLAVADLLVGLVILPFSLANEVLNGFWVFGDTWCTAWLTIDIWMSTSSVYNLVAISVDRYIAIIKPLKYPMIITKFRARLIVAAVWISSFIVCSPSFLLASSKRKSYIEEQMERNGTISAQQFVLQNPNACRCTPSNSGMYYILFSASSSFYIPYVIVIFVYVRIYNAAMNATRSAYAGMVQVAESAKKKQDVKKVPNGANDKSATVSKLKLPKLFVTRSAQLRKKHHLEMHRFSMDPPRSIPITINCNSSPIVYAQINGSCGNLGIGNNRFSDFERRRSEDQCLLEDRSGASPNGRSEPSEMVYASHDRLAPLAPRDAVGDTSEESNGSGDESKSMLTPNKTVGGTEASKLEGGHTANGNANSGEVPNSKEPQGAMSAIKRRRNFAARLMSRILGKAKRRRAAGTYEKRLSLEIKAAKTVAIVTGCFICCWLGFSIYYGLTAFDVYVNEVVWSIFFWLGYLNSAFNPVIYTVFNREFRTCFKQLLTCNNMIFAGRNGNQAPMCNSFNSQLRIGNDAMVRRQQGEQSEDA